MVPSANRTSIVLSGLSPATATTEAAGHIFWGQSTQFGRQTLANTRAMISFFYTWLSGSPLGSDGFHTGSFLNLSLGMDDPSKSTFPNVLSP